MNKLILRPYQQAGRDFLVEKKRAYLTDVPGLGKTVTALSAMQKLQEGPTLILGPKNSLYVWFYQANDWFNLNSVVYTGKPKQRGILWDAFIDDPTQLLITNYSFIGEIIELSNVYGIKWDTIICDEIHSGEAGLLNQKNKTFKKFRTLARQCSKLFLLTGTPIRRNPADLFAPLHLLDPQTFPSYWKFINEHCIIQDGSFGMEILPQPRNPKELSSLLSNFMIRRTKRQVVPELPPKIRQVLPIDMTPKQSRIYKQLIKDMVYVGDDTVIISANQATNILRQRQLLVTPRLLGIEENGGALDELIYQVDNSFMNNEAVVIFTPFNDNGRCLSIIEQQLKQKLGKIQVFKIMGGMKSADISTQWRTFQTIRTKRKALLATVQSGASWEATEASHVYFLGCDWSAINNYQAEDRAHRMITKYPVNIWYLLYRNSVPDELIMDKLNSKTQSANWVLNTEEVIKRFQNLSKKG